jgi:hypothetical protein
MSVCVCVCKCDTKRLSCVSQQDDLSLSLSLAFWLCCVMVCISRTGVRQQETSSDYRLQFFEEVAELSRQSENRYWGHTYRSRKA